MIKAVCFTNLDEYNHAEWPECFVAIPRIGDRVEGQQGGLVSHPTLRVVSVTHAMRTRTDPDSVRSNSNLLEPYIRVELHR